MPADVCLVQVSIKHPLETLWYLILYWVFFVMLMSILYGNRGQMLVVRWYLVPELLILKERREVCNGRQRQYEWIVEIRDCRSS
jgi:hypothetical protein